MRVPMSPTVNGSGRVATHRSGKLRQRIHAVPLSALHALSGA